MKNIMRNRFNCCRQSRWFSVGVLVASGLLPCASSANAAITITTTLPGYYTFNNVIQPVAMQATGARTALQWSISAGSLPPGLNLTIGGGFSGTPSAAGTFSFTVTATAPAEPTNTPGTKSFIIGVPQITTASPLPPASVGVPYFVQFQASDAPSSGAVWSVSLGGLPIGLTINNQTGVYSGTPTRSGTFSPAVSVSYGVASATKPFSLTINPASQPLTVAPSALQFTASIGNISGVQDLAVSSAAAAPVSFTIQIDDGNGGPAPAWLQVAPKGGTTPSVLRVSLVSTTLAAGGYNARIRVGIAAAGAVVTPVDVPVTLTVSNPPPNLSTAPSILRFTGRVANLGAMDQTFVLRNTGGGGSIPFSFAVVGQSPWINAVSVSAQTIVPGSPVTVKVTVNSQGLGPGSYQDAIRVTTQLGSPFNQFDVPVLLVIAGQGAVMSVAQTGVRFATTQGNQSSRSQQIAVRNVGDSGSTVNWAAAVVQGASLVTLTNATGVSTPGNATSFSVSLSNTAASSPGGQFALIQVTDPQALNATQFVVVVADVAPAGAPAVPDPSPAGLLFLVTSGIPVLAQQITVNTTSASPVAFFASAFTDDGASWLALTPSSGTTSQANPAQASVSITPGSLPPGIYTATVNIGIGTSVSGVAVTMILRPSAAGTAIKPAPQPQISSCSPGAVVLAQTGIVDNFAVPAGWPATLTVQVFDDCGNPLTNASVAAAFSNGDPPLSLSGDGQSASYTATWQPRSALQGTTVTIDGSSGGLKGAETKIVGSVQSNAKAAPSLAIGGLLNNLNPRLGAPLAPGTVTQVYGDNFTDSADSAGDVPLPTTIKGVQVVVGGLSAPLFYVSKNQLVIQVPAELSANRTYPALVLAGNQYTLPQDIDLVAVTPGTVALSDGTLVAQHTDYTLVDANRPAKPNEPLTIYLVGMGATTPPVKSGTAAPSDPLARVSSSVQVTVDGQPAIPSFAGLTPGGVALYQINFAVPPGVKTGALDVVITQNDTKANATKLVVSQ
jgi:uncharacterized protein (TIGR03437 family)